jgi:hypothetical protein
MLLSFLERQQRSCDRSFDGRRIANYTQWESRDLLRAAHQSPQFRKAWSQFERLTDDIDPHLYEVTEILADKQ